MVIVIIEGMVSEVIIIRDITMTITIMMIVREIVREIVIVITITIVTTKTIAINPISTT